MNKLFILLIFTVLFVNTYSAIQISTADQRFKVSINHSTILDASVFRGLFRTAKKSIFNIIQRNSTKLYEHYGKLGKLQQNYDGPFFCDVNGPGRRSSTIPTSVHQLTPGDIDIIGAIGDSLTAGNGLLSFTYPEIYLEFRGMSFIMGGHGTWRDFLTVPNILKEFNPDLYGYSTGNGFSNTFQTLSRFNVAEFGGMSRDLPNMARVLVKRMATDPKVKIHEHWKFINVHVGGNDFCIDMCYHKDPYKFVELHEKDLVETLRILRDNLPRTMVNVVMAPDVFVLARDLIKIKQCETPIRFHCPCLTAFNYEKDLYIFEDVVHKWQKIQEEVVDRPEFNSQDFTVNFQKFSQSLNVPKNEDYQPDVTFVSSDCFHLSQKGNAAVASAIWRSLLEPYNEKTTEWHPERGDFPCPTNEHPYLRTREN